MLIFIILKVCCQMTEKLLAVDLFPYFILSSHSTYLFAMPISLLTNLCLFFLPQRFNEAIFVRSQCYLFALYKMPIFAFNIIKLIFYFVMFPLIRNLLRAFTHLLFYYLPYHTLKLFARGIYNNFFRLICFFQQLVHLFSFFIIYQDFSSVP